MSWVIWVDYDNNIVFYTEKMSQESVFDIVKDKKITTVDEIIKITGLRRGTVNNSIRKLENQGLVIRHPQKKCHGQFLPRAVEYVIR